MELEKKNNNKINNKSFNATILLEDNIWIPIQNYKLNINDLNLDIYKQLKRQGYLHDNYKLQHHTLLRNTFIKYITNIEKIDLLISNNLLFSKLNSHIDANYKIQFMRKTFLKLLFFCTPLENRYLLDQENIDKLDNVNYIESYKFIINYLFFLRTPGFLLWFFFQSILYINNNILNYRKNYEILLDYVYEKWDDKNKFGEKYSNKDYNKSLNNSTLYYYLAYHGLSNKNIISKWCKLQKKIYPDLNYLSKHLKIPDVPVIDSNYIDLDQNVLDENNKINLTITSKNIKNYLINKKCKFLINKDPKLEVLLIKYKDQFKNIEFKNIQSDESKNRILAKLSNKISNKIKICFISDKLTNINSVFRDRIGLIYKLDENYFDVHIGIFTEKSNFKYEDKDYIYKFFLEKFYKNNKIIYLNNDLIENQSKISQHEFHIIFYPDIGMLINQTLLSYAKLAPIQITSWGHSDTSGNCSIDYFITSKYFETIEDISNIKNNYYEKPIIMNSISTFYFSQRKLCRDYVDKNFENKLKQKINYGFKKDDILIGCMQSFFKIYGDFEDMIKKILENTQSNVYILFCNSIPFNKMHLYRLNNKLKHNINRIKWFQNKNMIDWLNLVYICDFMIDPFPFGGCNTTLEAFDFDIPVVCLPSKVINGKFTEGFYKLMGFDNCIAKNFNDYYNIVKNMILNDDFKNNIKLLINKNKGKLFEQEDVIYEYQNIFVKLIDKHYKN